MILNEGFKLLMKKYYKNNWKYWLAYLCEKVPNKTVQDLLEEEPKCKQNVNERPH